MKTEDIFSLADEHSEEEIIKSLESKFLVRKEQRINKQLTFFDTFDWRLFKASRLLCQSGNSLMLRHLHNDQVLLCQTVAAAPRFIWEVPDGSLKSRLEPIIEMRALLELTMASIWQTPYYLLNEDEKTVVRFICQTIETYDGNQPIANQLRINPVRGYEKAAEILRHQLKEMKLRAESDNVLIKLLESGDRTPDDYFAGLKVNLDPGMRADEATKAILRPALRIMKLNEYGIQQDIDTEFLHDFRVAVRRTRSALSQVKDVFSAETTQRFKRDFAVIGKQTNELRDLDVYLLAEDTYKALLPENMRGDIDPLFAFMRQKRTSALQNVIDGLNSTHYCHTLQAWEEFLNEPVSTKPMAGQAATPIKILAQNRIYKKYRRIVKRGNRILKHTEDDELHALRIECKNLRYLMDFFRSLFPGKKANKLVEQVKKLQTNLGDFNDLSVQEAYLLNLTRELPASPDSRKVLVAVGFLIAAIQRERQLVKANFSQTFTKFARPANQKQFKKLFAPGK